MAGKPRSSLMKFTASTSLNKTRFYLMLKGTITLIGATTENPSFEVNPALLSRTRVIRFDRIPEEALVRILKRALTDSKRGLGGYLHLSEDALAWLAGTSEGDARRALTSLENIALQARHAGADSPLTLQESQEALDSALKRNNRCLTGKRARKNITMSFSAFIKSIRDSDPHCGLVLSGEDDRRR